MKSALYPNIGKIFIPIKEQLLACNTQEEIKNLKLQFLKNECLKYKTINELNSLNPNLYNVIKYNGWREECFSHLLRCNSSRGEKVLHYFLESLLNETANINVYGILPKKLELDIYFPQFNLAFEYDGSYWHKDNKKISSDLLKEQFCKDNNITLLRIKEDAYKNQNLDSIISNIKEQLINCIPSINQKTGKNISAQQIYELVLTDYSILFTTNYNLDDIKQAITQCNSRKEFYKKFSKYASFLRKNNYSHLLKNLPRINSPISGYTKFNKEEFLQWVAKTFKYYQEFTNHQCYDFAYYHGYTSIIRCMLPTKPIERNNWQFYAKMSNEEVIQFIKITYSSYKELTTHTKFYKFCHKRKLIPIIKLLFNLNPNEPQHKLKGSSKPKINYLK